jgi:hypothetical protein
MIDRRPWLMLTVSVAVLAVIGAGWGWHSAGAERPSPVAVPSESSGTTLRAGRKTGDEDWSALADRLSRLEEEVVRLRESAAKADLASANKPPAYPDLRSAGDESLGPEEVVALAKQAIQDWGVPGASDQELGGEALSGAEERFGSEAIDQEWSAQVEAGLEADLQGVADPGFSLSSVECRETSCRFEITAEAVDAADIASRLLDLQTLSNTQYTVFPGTSPDHAVVHMSRPIQ